MRPERKKNRLAGYDYSEPGYYYITICSQDRQKIFWAKTTSATMPYDTAHRRGEHRSPAKTSATANGGSPAKTPATANGGFHELSEIGRITQEMINKIEIIYPNVSVEKYCIMPEHIHMVLYLSEPTNNNQKASVSRIIKQLKGAVTKQTGFGKSIWQKSFYDEILRNDKACDAVYRYIDENPIYYENDDV